MNESKKYIMEKQEEVTYYRFLSEVKSFLSKLLKEPINAQPSKFLKDKGFNKDKLIKILIKRDILERNEKILTPDKTGEKNVKYCVTYKVKRKDFERKIQKIHIQYFEKNVPEKKEELSECDCGACMGGGATTTGSVGAGTTNGGFLGYVAPMSPNVLRRKTYESKKINENRVIAYHGSVLGMDDLVDDRWTYFTDNPEYAKEYGYCGEGGTYKAELTLNNPFYIESLDGDIFDEETEEYCDSFLNICKQLNVQPKIFEDYGMFDDIQRNSLWEIINDDFFICLVEKKGFDSIISEESGERVYVTFHPKQIKWIDKINEAKKYKTVYVTENQINKIKTKMLKEDGECAGATTTSSVGAETTRGDLGYDAPAFIGKDKKKKKDNFLKPAMDRKPGFSCERI